MNPDGILLPKTQARSPLPQLLPEIPETIPKIWTLTPSCTACVTPACPFALLDEILTQTVTEVSRQYQLTLSVFHHECFGMGEQDE